MAGTQEETGTYSPGKGNPEAKFNRIIDVRIVLAQRKDSTLHLHMALVQASLDTIQIMCIEVCGGKRAFF